MENYFNLILQNRGLNHITIKIFKYLDSISLYICFDVSRLWLQFIKENKTIWRQHILVDETKGCGWLLHNACYYGHPLIVKLLIRLGFDVNIPNQYDETPLICAMYKGHLEIIKILLFSGKVDVNIKGRGRSALHMVTMTPRHEESVKDALVITKYLLNYDFDFDVNAVCLKGMTALHWACVNGHIEIVRLLLRQPNIDLNIKCNKGKTMFDYAVEKGNEEIVDLVCKHKSRKKRRKM